MTLHLEDAALDLRVPHVDVVVQACTEDHVHVSVPIQCVHTKLVTLRKDVLKLERVHVPQRNLLIHTCRGDVAHRRDRQEVEDVTSVDLVFILTNVFEIDVVGMDLTFKTGGEDPIDGLTAPFDWTQIKLRFKSSAQVETS